MDIRKLRVIRQTIIVLTLKTETTNQQPDNPSGISKLTDQADGLHVGTTGSRSAADQVKQ
jgi:hypothetical protein